MVALVARQIACRPGPPQLLCTGTLVGPRVVLTAAHCLKRYPPAGIDAVFGESLQGARHPIESGAIHPHYDPETFANDLAVLVLERDAPPGIRPARISSEPARLEETTKLWWIGFGAASPMTRSVGARRTGTATVLESRPDRVSYSGEPMTCQGDSGGPLFACIGGRQEIVGVTSWGDPTCKSLGVANRVHGNQSFLKPFLELPPVPPRPSRPPLDPVVDLCGITCRSDRDCPEGMICRDLESGSSWCSYAGLPRGRFTEACSEHAECRPDSTCVALEGGCRCFEICRPAEEEHTDHASIRGLETQIFLTVRELAAAGADELPDAGRFEEHLAEILLVVEPGPRGVRGLLKTVVGGLVFSSEVQKDGLLEVSFELPSRRKLGMTLDRERSRGHVAYAEGEAITTTDHFLFQVLSRVLGRGLPTRTPESEALQRAANLWAEHPIGPITIREISAGGAPRDARRPARGPAGGAGKAVRLLGK